MFNRAPKRIPIPGAENKQFVLIFLGLLFGAIAFFAINDGSFIGFLINGGICALFWRAASKVKTHRKAAGQRTVYK